MNCSQCGSPIREGELLCQVCGALQADDMLTRRLKIGGESSIQPRVKSGVGSGPLHTITLNAEQQAYECAVKGGASILLGRCVPPDAAPESIDFAPVGAGEKGVSRQHALIRVDRGAVFVSDLESTNGTFLNGRRLQPHFQHLLVSGDVLRLGALEIRVQIS